jgi:hypothetical protein
MHVAHVIMASHRAAGHDRRSGGIGRSSGRVLSRVQRPRDGLRMLRAAHGNREGVEEFEHRGDGTPAPEDEQPRSAAIGEEAPPREEQPPRSAVAGEPATMIPSRGRRRLGVERVLMRLVATGGIVGIGVLLGAVLVSQDVAGWIVGLVVALTSVVLAAVLWSSRQL